ncbi:beta-galactosidase [Calidithermus timidus]|jgi:hypothetical protein|uniref:beta-galactosidase n=1 Tax=Calidithermus timidus TaxID=307124 RepID=UPI0003709E7B|nr:beta-galactosidase [Calidithermus timidus]
MNQLIRLQLGLSLIGLLLLASQESRAADAVPGYRSTFLLGVFASTVALEGATGIKRMVQRLEAHKMNAAIVQMHSKDKDLFRLAEGAGIKLLFAPAYELDRSWWGSDGKTFPDTPEQARKAAEEIIGGVKSEKSLLGYVLYDEPGPELISRVCRITQAFRQADPERAVTGVFIGTDPGRQRLVRECQPNVVLIDVYPFTRESKPGDFTMRGFFSSLDFVDYIRSYSRYLEGRPLWVLLQTHGTDWEGYKLREPSRAELRAMNWMALGEGADGIFYFHWSSFQTWRGLGDNPELLSEVGDFAERIQPIKGLLAGLERVEGEFFAHPTDPHHYVSTLQRGNSPEEYVVVVNRDVQRSRNIAVISARTARLRDLLSGRVYALGEAIRLGPGDGRIFQAVP